MTELEKFAALVRNLRQAQRAYFRVRSDKELREAKELEKKVDGYLDALTRGPDLFAAQEKQP